MSIKEQCLKLKSEGKSYSEICSILQCSKSTVAYHLNSTTKIAVRKWQNNKRKEDWIYKFMYKCSNFLTRKYTSKNLKVKNLDWNKMFRTRVSEFCNRYKEKGNLVKKCNYKVVLDYLKGTKVNCYLTGTPIDLEKDDYCFDHIIPVSKGGTNDLNNLGITIPAANYAKNNLTVDEFINLCKLVLEHHGYIVSKQ